MFHDILFSPIIFLESIVASFVLPKATSINPVYGSAATGSILSGLAITGIIPEINSFIGLVMSLVSLFALFCIQTMIDIHNSKKTISIWSNCIGLSCYGLISGISLGLTSDIEFIQYAASIMMSTLAISYSLGYRYIEYISNFKDKIPIVLFSLSAPLGIMLGRYSPLDSLNPDVLLGISAGTFLFFGMHNIINSGKSTDNISLENQDTQSNHLVVCLCVLAGFILSTVLQSSLLTDSNETGTLINSNTTVEVQMDLNSTSLTNYTE